MTFESPSNAPPIYMGAVSALECSGLKGKITLPLGKLIRLRVQCHGESGN